MRLTTYNKLTDLVAIGLGITFMALSATAVVLMLSMGIAFIYGAFACAPSP